MHLFYVYDIVVPSRKAAPIQILNTARALCEQGATVHVLVEKLAAPSAVEALAAYNLAHHPRLHLVPFPQRGRARLTLRRRVRALLQTVPDGEQPVVMSRGEPGLVLFERLRALRDVLPFHFVYEAHRLSFTEVDGWFSPQVFRRWRTARLRAKIHDLERAAVEQADGLVCLTHGVRAALEEHFRVSAPTLVLPSGATLAPSDPTPLHARDLDVFYAGKLLPRKGVFDLVEAMRFVPGQRLHIAGGSADEIATLRRHAEEHGVGDRVETLGYVDPADIGALYRRARVGACPLPEGESAIAERFTSPLKVMEMMAYGVPIVATDVPSLRELLTPGETALFAPPSDPERLGGAIRTLLNDPGLGDRLARTAREEALQYTWSNRARRLLDFVEAIQPTPDADPAG